MLINAMEVSGIEGNFRLTCESVMRVLRANKESVMAMLEAFVHDPLINWRLLNPSPRQTERDQGTRTSHIHTRAGGGGEEAGSVAVSCTGVAHAGDRGRGTNWATGIDIAVGRGAVPRPLVQHGEVDAETGPAEALNAKAVTATNRVRQKLTGRDFNTAQPLDVADQVARLIQQATSHENLCQLYVGWCPFW